MPKTCPVVNVRIISSLRKAGSRIMDRLLLRSNHMAVAPRTVVITSSLRKERLPRIASPLRRPPTTSRRKASRQPHSNRHNRAPLLRCRPSSLLPKMMPTLRFSSLV